MKSMAKTWLAGAALGLVLPGVLLNAAVMRRETPQETVAREEDPGISLPVLVREETGMVRKMDMDDYLLGVVLGEMPASFEPEALKAQAVAARTYARKAYVTGGKHGDGSVCQDPGCCQAYVEERDYLEKGGTAEGAEKIRNAVADTSGFVLTYGGELIEATYFSCSGGSTEDAAAVWGTDYPYLQAVDSPGEEKAAHYRRTVSFTAEEFQQALDVELEGTPDTWFHDISFTQGGGVAAMGIGGQSYTGTQLRSKLGLDSTAFAVEVSGDTVTVTTHGYGHRVGMSQYGADAMAVTGSSWREILAHYYPGVEIVRLPSEQD